MSQGSLAWKSGGLGYMIGSIRYHCCLFRGSGTVPLEISGVRDQPTVGGGGSVVLSRLTPSRIHTTPGRR